MHGVCLGFEIGLHLGRENLTVHHWLMDNGAQKIGGGKLQMMTDSSTDHTMTYSS